MAFGSSEIPADSTKKKKELSLSGEQNVTLTYEEKEILRRQWTEG